MSCDSLCTVLGPAAVTLAAGLAAPGVTGPSPSQRVTDAIHVVDGPCLASNRVVESTQAWLGREQIEAGIRVDVHALTERAIQIQLHQDDQLIVERVLDPAPARCEDRHAALGLLIAMAIDERVAEEAGLGPVRTTEPPTTVPAPAGPSRPGEDGERAPRLDATQRQPEPSERVTPVLLFAGAVVGFELMPGVAFGGRAGVTVGVLPWLDFDAEALFVAGLPFTLGEGEVSPLLAGGGVGLCPVRRTGRWQIRLCVSALGAAVVARGTGYDEGLTTVLPWVALRAAPDVRLRLGRRAQIGLNAGVAAPLLNASFELVNDGGIPVERRSTPAAAMVAGIDFAIDLRSKR